MATLEMIFTYKLQEIVLSNSEQMATLEKSFPLSTLESGKDVGKEQSVLTFS